jgi:hypothetical protein
MFGAELHNLQMIPDEPAALHDMVVPAMSPPSAATELVGSAALERSLLLTLSAAFTLCRAAAGHASGMLPPPTAWVGHACLYSSMAGWGTSWAHSMALRTVWIDRLVALILVLLQPEAVIIMVVRHSDRSVF